MVRINGGDELLYISDLKVKECIITSINLYEEIFDVTYEDGGIKQFDDGYLNQSMFYNELITQS